MATSALAQEHTSRRLNRIVMRFSHRFAPAKAIAGKRGPKSVEGEKAAGGGKVEAGS
jgi:hypothetical protein